MSSIAVVATKIDDLKEDVKKLDEKMDGQFSEVKLRQDKTNGRLRTLETWRAWLIGFSVCLSLIVAPILVYIWENHVAENMAAEAKAAPAN